MHLPQSCRGQRSHAFFALNSLGSYRLYQSFCIPILPYGSELHVDSKYSMLERVHRKILRTTQGLPSHCPASSLSTLLGTPSVEDLIKQHKFNFIIATAHLDPLAFHKKLLTFFFKCKKKNFWHKTLCKRQGMHRWQ